VPGALDGSCQDPLVFGAGSSLTAGADLSFFGHKTTQHICLFIIYGEMFICAELANLGAGKISTIATLFHITIITRFTFHNYFYSNLIQGAEKIFASNILR
jgi:hypothetical protein